MNSKLSEKNSFPYLVSYFCAAIVFLNSCFFDKKFLVYTLPLLIVAIAFVYIKTAKKVNKYLLLGFLAVLIGDVFIYLDALLYFPYICIFFSLYFFLNTITLRDFISFDKFEIKKFFNLPLLVSTVLIIYLIYSITILILPKVDAYLVHIFFLVYTLLLNLAVSYYIYAKDIYKKGLSLLMVASVYIFLITIMSINELIYYNRFFTIIANFVHILGFYLLLYFFTDPKPYKKGEINENYF